MAEVHLVVGCALIALNLAAFAVGGVAWLRSRASVPFWYLLRAAQVSVFIQAMLGGLLVDAAQRELGDIDFEALSTDHQQSLALAIVRREMGIMTVSCGVILFLALRAAGTSGAF
jgi:hypothetical protein